MRVCDRLLRESGGSTNGWKEEKLTRADYYLRVICPLVCYLVCLLLEILHVADKNAEYYNRPA